MRHTKISIPLVERVLNKILVCLPLQIKLILFTCLTRGFTFVQLSNVQLCNAGCCGLDKTFNMYFMLRLHSQLSSIHLRFK